MHVILPEGSLGQPFADVLGSLKVEISVYSVQPNSSLTYGKHESVHSFFVRYDQLRFIQKGIWRLNTERQRVSLDIDMTSEITHKHVDPLRTLLDYFLRNKPLFTPETEREIAETAPESGSKALRHALRMLQVHRMLGMPDISHLLEDVLLQFLARGMPSAPVLEAYIVAFKRNLDEYPKARGYLREMLLILIQNYNANKTSEKERYELLELINSCGLLSTFFEVEQAARDRGGLKHFVWRPNEDEEYDGSLILKTDAREDGSDYYAAGVNIQDDGREFFHIPPSAQVPSSWHSEHRKPYNNSDLEEFNGMIQGLNLHNDPPISSSRKSNHGHVSGHYVHADAGPSRLAQIEVISRSESGVAPKRQVYDEADLLKRNNSRAPISKGQRSEIASDFSTISPQDSVSQVSTVQGYRTYAQAHGSRRGPESEPPLQLQSPSPRNKGKQQAATVVSKHSIYGSSRRHHKGS